MTDILPHVTGFNWPAVVALLGGGAGGGMVVRLHAQWQAGRAAEQSNRTAARKQTDDVALDLVERLSDRIRVLELKCEALSEEAKLERELCAAKLEVVGHEMKNVEASFDALLLALKYAPPERHEAIVNEVATWREEKKRLRALATAQRNEGVQIALSTERNRQDAASS